MEQFTNILFVSSSVTETEALKQALSIARNSQGALRALVLVPEFPTEFADQKARYEAFLHSELQRTIQAARAALKLSAEEYPVEVDVETGAMPAERIVRKVLLNAYDLVVKEANPRDSGRGFKAMDMELLRKCPCPVLLCRPIDHSRHDIRVAVAIDPQSEEPGVRALAIELLRLSRSLADTCSGELYIVSCWHYEYEDSLRDNPWIKVTPEELRATLQQTQSAHKAALDGLIHESSVGGVQRIHCIKGRPEQMIPSFVETENVDILVMGTVGRTGIAGFIFGNTAENLVQKLRCSLLAMKPAGFVSPVDA